MGWFPAGRSSQSQDGWQFDIVSLLTVIGQSSIKRHVQVISASSFAALPRLLPAPQSVLKTERPTRLPSVKDVVISGVYSGTLLTELNFFADVIHDIETLEPYEFQVYNITYANGNDAERQQRRQKTTFWFNDSTEERMDISVKMFCPLNVVTILSVLATVALFIWAGVIHDGIAMIAIATMSLSTSLACLSAEWYPILSKRPTDSAVPPGDIVISTRKGAFVVVHCEEDIARELYHGTETCRYVFKEQAHQALLGVSTVLLMASILLFSNCTWTMQSALSVAYIVLNILYWAVPLVMNKQEIWDMSRYEVRRQPVKFPETFYKPSYTQSLWYAIYETKRTGWVENARLAPSTDKWAQWLREAQQNCNNEQWDAVGIKNRLMEEARNGHCTPSGRDNNDG